MSEQTKQSQEFADKVLLVTLQLSLLLNELKEPPPGDPIAAKNPGYSTTVILIALYVTTELLEARVKKDYEKNRERRSPSTLSMVSNMKIIARELRKHFKTEAARVSNFEGMNHEETEQALALLMTDADTLPRA